MNYVKTAARFSLLLLPIVILSFAITLSATKPCHAQIRTFTGNGNGSSWNDASNWSGSGVPGMNSNARISSTSETGFSVQLNLPLTVATIGIDSREFEGVFRTASLSVNAPLSASSIGCEGERGFFSMNANVTGSLNITSGATLNLNSGMLTASRLNFSEATFNQNGGNFNVECFSISNNTTTTATIGPNDNVTDIITLTGGNVICERPILLNDAGLGGQAALTINDDFTAMNSFELIGSVDDAVVPTLIWNQGDITAPFFCIQNAVINRTGGRLMAGDISLSRGGVAGMSLFTIREDDVISGSFTLCDQSGFPIAATFEGPHSLEGIAQFGDSVVNYQQSPGATEGLALGRYSRFNDSTLNLGFDSQSVGGLDWVLRVDGNEVEDLEEMIEDGRIVVTGADFAVEYDAVNDVTYIQQQTLIVAGR